MNVRALPTWRNPVGEGANRTRGLASELPCKDESVDSDIKGSRELQIYDLIFNDLTFDGKVTVKIVVKLIAT